MHRVVALVLPQVVAFDLAVPAQVFGHPDEGDRYRFEVCTPVPGLVPSTTRFAVSALRGLGALAAADTIVVPGYTPLMTSRAPKHWKRCAAAATGTRIVSVCTGAFTLAAAGLLDDRRATTHWRDAAELAARYPSVRLDADVLYVGDEAVMSSAGVAAGIDLCVHLVRTDHGESIASEVARRMVVAPHRTGGQDRHAAVTGLLAKGFSRLTLPYSSGQVEGTVNKIEMVKRQMFGRAKFDLLRKRVLLAS